MPAPVAISPLIKASADERRVIHEATLGGDDAGEVSRFTLIETFTGADSLGNHYHDQQEVFLLVVGMATLHTQDIRSDSPAETSELAAPCVITVPAGVAHTFVPHGEITLVCFTGCSYEDLGTHRHFLA